MKHVLTLIGAALALLAWLFVIAAIWFIAAVDWLWKWCGMAVEFLLSEADGILYNWQKRLKP